MIIPQHSSRDHSDYTIGYLRTASLVRNDNGYFRYCSHRSLDTFDDTDTFSRVRMLDHYYDIGKITLRVNEQNKYCIILPFDGVDRFVYCSDEEGPLKYPSTPLPYCKGVVYYGPGYMFGYFRRCNADWSR